MSDLVSITADLCLGSIKPHKRVHHSHCPFARTPYTWARETGSVFTMVDKLIEDGAWRWHRFCQRCCGDVDDVFRGALRARGIDPAEVDR